MASPNATEVDAKSEEVTNVQPRPYPLYVRQKLSIGHERFHGDNELESALHSSLSSCQILPRLRLTEDGVRCTKRSPFEHSFVLLVE